MQANPSSNPPKGLVIAATTSNSGKTTVTLGLLRALSRHLGHVQPFKSGPDYIDPAFHSHAAHHPCYNLDLWSMRGGSLTFLLEQANGSDFFLIEGVMGLYDGAKDGTASTADLAHFLNLPVILILDVKGQATSAMAQIHGFRHFPGAPAIAGVIFNRVGSDNHKKMLEDALKKYHPDLALLGALPNNPALKLPERHLGLVQAEEHPELETFLNQAGDLVEHHCDIQAILQSGHQPNLQPIRPEKALLPVLGQHIAIARDEAFAFCYPGQMKAWKDMGATLSFFSPLANEQPDSSTDAIYLPGGYPELHAGKLAANHLTLDGLRTKASKGCFIYGECGGFMLLGEGLEDAEGQPHQMAGLLPVETSFKTRKLHLGYRQITALQESPLGPIGSQFRGHEFHYSSVNFQATNGALFDAKDALGHGEGPVGLMRGSVAGSYLHLIDKV